MRPGERSVVTVFTVFSPRSVTSGEGAERVRVFGDSSNPLGFDCFENGRLESGFTNRWKGSNPGPSPDYLCAWRSAATIR